MIWTAVPFVELDRGELQPLANTRSNAKIGKRRGWNICEKLKALNEMRQWKMDGGGDSLRLVSAEAGQVDGGCVLGSAIRGTKNYQKDGRETGALGVGENVHVVRRRFHVCLKRGVKGNRTPLNI